MKKNQYAKEFGKIKERSKEIAYSLEDTVEHLSKANLELSNLHITLEEEIAALKELKVEIENQIAVNRHIINGLESLSVVENNESETN